MLKKISLITVCAVSVFAMHNAEININDKDLEIGARLDMGQFNDTTEPNTVFVGAKFLHGHEDHSDFDRNSIHDFSELNFMMQREIDASGLAIGLGVKLNHTENFTSIPLGIEASYKLPTGIVTPLYIGGSLYYAPEVLSLEDAKNFLEYRVNFDIEVIKNGRISLGYRSIDTNYDVNGNTNNVNYNRSAHLGFKFAF